MRTGWGRERRRRDVARSSGNGTGAGRPMSGACGRPAKALGSAFTFPPREHPGGGDRIDARSASNSTLGCRRPTIGRGDASPGEVTSVELHDRETQGRHARRAERDGDGPGPPGQPDAHGAVSVEGRATGRSVMGDANLHGRAGDRRVDGHVQGETSDERGVRTPDLEVHGGSDADVPKRPGGLFRSPRRRRDRHDPLEVKSQTARQGPAAPQREPAFDDPARANGAALGDEHRASGFENPGTGPVHREEVGPPIGGGGPKGRTGARSRGGSFESAHRNAVHARPPRVSRPRGRLRCALPVGPGARALAWRPPLPRRPGGHPIPVASVIRSRRVGRPGVCILPAPSVRPCVCAGSTSERRLPGRDRWTALAATNSSRPFDSRPAAIPRARRRRSSRGRCACSPRGERASRRRRVRRPWFDASSRGSPRGRGASPTACSRWSPSRGGARGPRCAARRRPGRCAARTVDARWTRKSSPRLAGASRGSPSRRRSPAWSRRCAFSAPGRAVAFDSTRRASGSSVCPRPRGRSAPCSASEGSRRFESRTCP